MNNTPNTFRDLSAAHQFAPVVSSAGSYMGVGGMLVGDDGLPESLETPNTPFVFKGHPEATAIFAMPAADYCRTPPCPADLLTGAPAPAALSDVEWIAMCAEWDAEEKRTALTAPQKTVGVAACIVFSCFLWGLLLWQFPALRDHEGAPFAQSASAESAMVAKGGK